MVQVVANRAGVQMHMGLFENEAEAVAAISPVVESEYPDCEYDEGTRSWTHDGATIQILGDWHDR